MMKGKYDGKICFCYPAPDEIKPSRFGYSLSMLYAAQEVIDFGYDVRVFDFSLEKFIEADFLSAVENSEALFVELDSFPLKRSINLSHARIVLTLVKLRYPSIPIFAYGKYCILKGDMVENADFTVLSPIEYAMKCILEKIRYKGDNKEPRVLCYPLPEIVKLPVPARYLIDEILINKTLVYRKLAPSALVRTSQGCYGSCTFCQRKGWNERVIFHDEGDVISEILLLKERYANIWIEDDNFTVNLGRAKRILASIVDNSLICKLFLSSWTKIDKCVLTLMKEAGVSIVSFGIETINPPSQVFYNKIQSPEHIQMLVEYADSIGLFVVGNFIIGSPYDTENSIEKDIQFATSIPFDQVNVKVLDYMPGSALYGYLPVNLRDGKDHFASSDYKLTKLSLSELRLFAHRFQEEFCSHRKSFLMRKIVKYGFPYNFTTDQGTDFNCFGYTH